ncbi:HAD-IA family hydrolase [Paenibacillus turpanensis]|uniref:HAD-IA family hydrolase n=1 Tax=Paenibacillus turpanensis TaxID=2689078 RepID=UPI00140ACDC8
MKAVVFDFDGLIIDTESYWYYAFRDVLREEGLELPIEQFAVIVGTTDEALNDYIRKELGDSADYTAIRERARLKYKERMIHPVLRDGVADYLQASKQLGLRIGLASSSSREWVEGYARQTGIFDYFEVVRTKEDVEKVKPDPALYRKAVEALGIDPSEAVAFEDSLNGLRAAKGAGLHCVIVPNEVTSHLPFEQYSLRLSSMSERSLEEVLQHIQG